MDRAWHTIEFTRSDVAGEASESREVVAVILRSDPAAKLARAPPRPEELSAGSAPWWVNVCGTEKRRLCSALGFCLVVGPKA